jgi:hypothetical protein
MARRNPVGSGTMNIPDYETPQKLAARRENARLYRALTGLYTLPKSRQYWTLCARQTAHPESEINQLVALGLLTKDQFYGVDRDPAFTDLNRLDHPEAHFPDAGEWSDIILDCDDFNPGLVYLDTMHEAGRLSLALAASTMPLCPAGTVLLCNVAQSSRFRAVMESEFITELRKRVPDFDSWTVHGESFAYCGSATLMRTYALRRDA